MNQAKKARRMAAALAVAVLLSTSMGTLSCADAAVSDGELDALQQEQLELQQQREKLEHEQNWISCVRTRHSKKPIKRRWTARYKMCSNRSMS